MIHKYVIVNADDFGLSHGCNRGIVKAILEGVVTSTTLMMNMSATADAIKLAKKHQLRCIGIHLNLTTGVPMMPIKNVPSLVRHEGVMTKENFELFLPLEEVEAEWRAQLRSFIGSGLELTHIDSHHHIHTQPHYIELSRKLAKEYKVPLRGAEEESEWLVPKFSSAFYDEQISVDFFKRLVTQTQELCMEIMVHPAQVDDELFKVSSYTTKRSKELAALTDLALVQWSKKQPIKWIHYGDLPQKSR
jgi:predicted glycoside hydrolase/deacetylase ChbG (UPF0249 family)